VAISLVAFLVGIPSLAIALLCTLFAVAHTGPQYDIEIINDHVVGGPSDIVVAPALATAFGGIGIFSLLIFRARLKEWLAMGSTRHLKH